MTLVGFVHGQYVHRRRVRVLSAHLSRAIPRGARVLDVGCGDGLLAHRIGEERADVEIQGIDVLVREGTRIPVRAFDGRTIPCRDGAFDTVMFVDVLHHTDDPMVLLREAVRASRHAVVIKDHLCDGPLARRRLRFMDRVGNARHGVALPFNYWPRRRWLDAFERLGLGIEAWTERLGLYPPPASWLFDDSLHFVARLARR